MELSIIIPAYNEEQRLPLTLQRIFEYLSVHYQGVYEIIVADDGSIDQTREVVEQYRRQYPQLRLLRFLKNRGRGAVVKDTVFETQGDFILQTDADGSVNEHAIVDFLQYFKKHPEVDMLTGSRTIEGSRILTPQPLVRKILGYSFFFLAKLMFGWKFMDRINGFKMFRRETALDIYQYQCDTRYLAEAEIVYIAEIRGWRVKELPILWTDYRGAKVKPFQESLRSLIGMFKILIRSKRGFYTQNLRRTASIERDREDQKKQTCVLVTGGCGFIGSNFIRRIYHHYPDAVIVNLDLLTYAGNRDNLKDIEEEDAIHNKRRYFFVHGDICDEQLLEKLFTEYQFDLVVHFAAESHVDRSIFSALDFVRTNIEGTRTLIEAARKAGVRRFVHISTDEIYGSYKVGYATEEWSMSPSSPYAASKAGADHLVQSYIKTYEFPAVIVRGSNNYGPYQYPEKLIPLAITNLLEGLKIPIHGYGAQVRSWLYVEDFCRAIDLIAWGQPKHVVYNVGGEEKSVLEVLQRISASMRKDLERNRFHVNDRPGADLRYAVDARRIMDDFGWKREHGPFDEKIQDVIQWYVDNQSWWKKIKFKEGYTEHYERQAKGRWT